MARPNAETAAAGRIEFTATDDSCSAALVAPNMVVTAAHCVGAAPSGYRFRPAGPIGTATHAVEAIEIHPLYQRGSRDWARRYRFDIAVARLTTPVPGIVASPLPAGEEAVVGEKLFLFSWRGGEQEKPRQRACEVVEGVAGLVSLGCFVSGGESGAPVLRKTERGLEIVAVVSSRHWIGAQPVAQATDVRLRLPPLLDAIE